MDNMNVAPIDHGVLSATSTVGIGAGAGFLKSGIKGYGYTAVISTVLGGLAGAGLLGGIGLIGAPILAGLGIGAAIGLVLAGPIVGGISAAIGAFTGGGRAVHQVQMEKRRSKYNAGAGGSIQGASLCCSSCQ